MRQVYKNLILQDLKKKMVTIVKESEIKKIIEAKLSDYKISKTLEYFKNKYSFESVQLVKNLR